MNRHARTAWSRLFSCLLAFLSFASFGAAQEAEDIANRIKAAYLFHFCSYVRWPEGAFESGESPIVIAVAGPPALVAEIATAIAGRHAGEREIKVRHVDRFDALDGVHLLYIDDAADAAAGRLLDAARDAPILTVTESSNGLDTGSAINFTLVDDRVRFDIAPGVIAARNLEVSAQLLAVARHVHEGEGEGEGEP